MEKLQTKLFEAATQNSIASLRQLLKDDPLLLDRALVNPFNETPLHVAAMLGNLEFVEETLRLKPELVNELNLQLSSPLHLAAAKGHVGVVKALLSVDNRACLVRDRNELLPLHLAAAKGHVEATKVLLAAQPDAAMVKIHGGESILHLCVKRYQLEALRLIMVSLRSDEFINSRDDDGNTLLHLAVADKQVETINFLVSVGGVEVNAVNHEGLTPLDVLIRSKRDLRDSQIEKSLKNIGGFAALENDNHNNPLQLTNKELPVASKKNSWGSLMKQHENWLEKQKSALMVVASLIATIAFQAGANPPGGVWQSDVSVDTQGRPLQKPIVAGSSVYAYKFYNGYKLFYIYNATAFIASLSIILLLMSGLPIRRRFFMWILMVTTWIAIAAIAFSYLGMLYVLTPADTESKKPIVNVIMITMIVWIVLMSLLLIGHTIRVILKVVKMVRKVWTLMRRRRGRSANLAGPAHS